MNRKCGRTMWYLSCNFYSIQFAHLCKEVFNLVVVSTSFFPASTPLFFLLLYIIGIFIHATFVFFLMANLFWRLKFIWNEKCQRWNAHEGQEQEPSKEKDECFVSQQDCKSSDSTVHKDFHISWLCVKFSLCFFKPSSKVRNHFLDFFFDVDVLRRFWMIMAPPKSTSS